MEKRSGYTRMSACGMYREWGEQDGKYAEAFKLLTEKKET